MFVIFKEIEDRTFNQAKRKLAVNIADLYKEHAYLLENDKVNPAT